MLTFTHDGQGARPSVYPLPAPYNSADILQKLTLDIIELLIVLALLFSLSPHGRGC